MNGLSGLGSNYRPFRRIELRGPSTSEAESRLSRHTRRRDERIPQYRQRINVFPKSTLWMVTTSTIARLANNGDHSRASPFSGQNYDIEEFIKLDYYDTRLFASFNCEPLRESDIKPARQMLLKI